MPRFQTTAVHAGREDFVELCVHAPPLDLSTTYPVPDLDVGSASFDALVAGQNPLFKRMARQAFSAAGLVTANSADLAEVAIRDPSDPSQTPSLR